MLELRNPRTNPKASNRRKFQLLAACAQGARRISELSLLDVLDEHDTGERNRTFSLCQFFWGVGITGDQVLAHECVECAITGRVVERKSFLVFKGSESLTPLGNYGLVPNPNLAGFRVEFVAQHEREDFLSFIEEKMGIGVCLGVGVVRIEQGGKRPSAANFVVRHAVSMA